MSHTCGLCDDIATLFCHDCPKIKFFCEPCCQNVHANNPKKASHKYETILSDEGETKEIVEIFCSIHSNKLKEYVCLVCDKSVCSDCIAYSPHKGHSMSSFQEGFTKLVKAFNIDAHKDDKYEDLSNENKVKISEFLKANIDKMRLMQTETESNFQKLAELMNAKKLEIIEFIEKEITKATQERDSLDTATGILKSSIEICNSKSTQSDKIGCNDYDSFEKAYSEIKRLKAFFAKWLSVDSMKDKSYPAISLNSIERMVSSLKMDERTFDVMAEPIFKDSSIVKDDSEQATLQTWVSEAYDNSRVKFQLLWRGSTDGFGASTFHSKCDNKGATFTIIRSEKGNVFGGYTSKSWKSSGNFTNDSKAFIYSLTYKEKHANQKESNNSVYYDSRFGPIFGSGFDICIVDHCNTSQKSYSEGNSTYELPSSVDIKNYYAGALKNKVQDIEVYSVSIQ